MSIPVTEIPVKALNIASRVAGFTDGYCYVFDLMSLAVKAPETPPDVRVVLEVYMQTRKFQNTVIGKYFQRITDEQTPQPIVN